MSSTAGQEEGIEISVDLRGSVVVLIKAVENLLEELVAAAAVLDARSRSCCPGYGWRVSIHIA